MCGTYDASLLNENFDSRMAKDRGWMYDGWKKSGAHTREWMNKTQEFIDRALSAHTTNAETLFVRTRRS
jgi:hypothetical protein